MSRAADLTPLRPGPRSLRAVAPPSVPRVLWRTPAWVTVAAAIALTAIGILAIRITDPEAQALYARKQVIFLGISLFGAGVAAVIHPRTYRQWSYVFAIVCIALLVLVLLPFVPSWLVTPRNGARRWINLHYTLFQPSELAKIAYILALANYLQFVRNYRTLVGLSIPFALMLVPMGLILIEPDLGTALLFPAILFAMLLAAGARLWHLGAVVVAGVSVAGAIAVISLAAASQQPPAYPLLREHQVERIQGIINNYTGDKRFVDSINYQSHKAMTLIGAGGFTGLGAERSRVIVEHNRLPEEHNDMIFAVAVNRWGFLGGGLIITLYALWCAGVLIVAAIHHDPFGRLVCVGFAANIAVQMTVNVGMSLGLLPITGMSLPFVSYGGSSLVTNFLMTGIALSIGLRPVRRPTMRAAFEYDHPPEKIFRDPITSFPKYPRRRR